MPRKPRVEQRVVAEKREIAFGKVRREDQSVPTGSTVTERQGVKGSRTMVYKVVLTEGKPAEKRLIANVITSSPVDEVIVVGTGQVAPAEPACDPNYSGCVPIASDVDCMGGKGNGPAYVRGPVTVTGTDIYGLDGDGDGIGCER